MFRALQTHALWARSLHACRAGDTQAALALAERSFALVSSARPHQIAFFARLLLLNDCPGKAERMFQQALVMQKSGRSDDAYVRTYAAYHLERLKMGERVERFWKRARTRPGSRFARLYLPLPAAPFA